MSRFVLRSNAEQTKLSEQKEKAKPLTSNSLKTPTKKNENKKGNKNCSASAKSLNLSKQITENNQKSPAKERISELEEQRGGKISIICSLPLSRLSGIIEKLSKSPQNYNDAQTLFSTISRQASSGIDQYGNVGVGGDADVVGDLDDVEDKLSVFDDDTSNSKSQDLDSVLKTLCLYCEKQFSTQKMQQKHIEKFHSPQKDRRCSVRNSQVLSSPRSKSANRQSSANRLAHNYPGCTYCKKLKLTESTDPVRDFNGLFLHLTEQHADKYFGCKICTLRFQNIGNLMKHMQAKHNTLPEAQLKLSKDYGITEEKHIETIPPPSQLPSPTNKPLTPSKQRSSSHREQETPASNSLLDQSDVIGSEDTILTRLGLTQNRRRMASNRKGVRLRRDTVVPDMLLKTEGLISTGAANTLLSTSPSKARSNKVQAKITNNSGGSDTDAVVFRVPARTAGDTLTTAFDENFYKEVTANVRNNLLFYLDGKLGDAHNSHTTSTSATNETTGQQNELIPTFSQTTTKSLPLLLRSTLVPTYAITTQESSESEIHVATNLPSTTAFPTLLTAEQYCGDVRKIRRPHTKHSWKWKWDSVKKYKLINEGGKMVKKAKHPTLGLRDLSKLDMWTQLSMRQKHEKQLIALQNSSNFDDFPSGEKRRLNDQLNAILDTRVLPHIILEQIEQAEIKLENDEFNFSSTTLQHKSLDSGDRDGGNDSGRTDIKDDFCARNIIGKTFSDESFLSLLQLVPRSETRNQDRKLVLSGEWARPRCYMCMCCGNRFEKLKSLEEHKTFRHSNIFSTHYEVVGRELLAGNLLQHLFIPKRALSYYSAPGAVISNSAAIGASAKKLMKYRRVNIAAEEESSDSVQSVSNSYTHAKHAFNIKNVVAAAAASTTDDCDTDTKTTLIGGEIHPTISPSNSFQSSFSSSLNANSNQSILPLKNSEKESSTAVRNWNCSKCSRKCNGISDLYRHMLDCSGDYIWSLAKKRKYRYYCGSKKRRQLHRQNSSELRKTNSRTEKSNSSKVQNIENCTTEESSSNSYKLKTPPRPRPSDAESIKKMLENLPPKRVCKTIFPTVSKAKKTKKPKFITKLYNTKILRKTRARQLAKAKRNASAARFAAKAKKAQSKTLNSINCRKNRKNACPKKQENAALSTAVSETSVTTDFDSKADDSEIVNLEEKHNSCQKNEVAPVQNEECNAISIRSSNSDNEAPKKSLNRTVEKSKLPKENDLNCNDVTDADEDKDANKPESESKSKISDNVSSNASSDKFQQKIASTGAAVQLASGNGIGSSDNSNSCIRKRSKRISDCIAMLTGKLEEKLKTESSTTSSTTSTSTRNDEGVESSEIRIATAVAEKEKEKKTPKRKTISRRIIKTDIATDVVSDSVSDCSSVALPAAIDNINAKLATTTTTFTKTTIAEEKPVAPAVAMIATTSFVASVKTTTTTTVATRATNKTPKIVAETKLLTPPMAKTITTKVIKAVAPIPPALACIPMTMPIATALHGLPVPLKVFQSQLPVYLPPPPPPTLTSSTLNATAISTLPVPLAASAVVPTLPVPTTSTTSAGVLSLPMPLSNSHTNAAALLPSPLTLLPPQPQPLLQAHISAATAASALPLASAMEPLNLSSAKSTKKPTTAELRAQRPGLPARRQTISGFEARDLLTYNGMEPLDLSVKSKAKPSTNSVPTAASEAATVRTSTANLPIYASVDLSIASKVSPMSADELATKKSANNLTHTTLTTLPTLPLQLPLPTSQTLATLPTNSETIFNKQFYSNLELLKIPQIRATGFLPPVVEKFNAITNGMMTTITPPVDHIQGSMPLTVSLPPPTLPMPLVVKTASTCSNTNESQTQTPQANRAEAPLSHSQIQAQKMNNQKKRGSNKTTNLEPAQITITAMPSTTSKTKDTNLPTKKEVAKQKPITKMDEEVINHIDDAINSVINAVKASLYESEQQLQQQQQLKLDDKLEPASTAVEDLQTERSETDKIETSVKTSTQAAKLTTTVLVESTPITKVGKIDPTGIEEVKQTQPSPVIAAASCETIDVVAFSLPSTVQVPSMLAQEKSAEIKMSSVDNKIPAASAEELPPASDISSITKPSFTLTPKKRNLRSKTLDCRSQLKEAAGSALATSSRNELQQITSKQTPKYVEKTNNTSIANIKEVENQKGGKIDGDTTTTQLEIGKRPSTEEVMKLQHEKTPKPPQVQSNKEPNQTKEDLKGQPISAIEQESLVNVNLTLATNEENISNIVNNTSSGFHSSSTPDNAAASTTVVGDIKKKQRRRRKNELAAIVADQLLESFKIDKARRDSLKKLENLAYEKSDDLLITGMLLMSSTKRSASSAVSFNQNAEKQRNAENAKRQKQHEEFANDIILSRPKSRNSKAANDELNKAPKESTTSSIKKITQSINETEDSEPAITKLVVANINSSDKQTEAAAVTVTSPPPQRRGRGRPARRRPGAKTPLDNENLSKLKSSLESFSIGIEKQLSEFEARNSAAAKAAKKSSEKDVESKAKKNSNQLATQSASTTTNSYILRPSILAASLEQAQQITTTATYQRDAKETRNEKLKDMKTPKAAITATTNVQATTTATVQTNSGNNFSRDPRLNKNIHKDETPAFVNASKNSVANSGQQGAATTEMLDIEDDNYLTEIAKNVNEKIMAAENEDFAFAENDDFEIGTEFNDDDRDRDQDDDDDEYSRPPTSMSVRSAPNFNDDHSNFGSICDENTNTEVMDMDLDDELSVYTSFSQDLGRGRGRKRRRRRSILLKRRPKKQRRSSQDLPAEKFECELCKKTFFAASSLAKHNMTLAHVSKVSEREYLMSKADGKAALFNDNFTSSFPKRQTRRKRIQSMNLDLLERKAFLIDSDDVEKNNEKNKHENKDRHKDELKASKPKVATPLTTAKPSSQQSTTETSQLSGQRLSMNPDERLFYECCNILKSADTTRTARNEQETAPTAQAQTKPTSTKETRFDNVVPALSEVKISQSTEPAPRQQDFLHKNNVLRPSSLQRVMQPVTTTNLNMERHVHSPTYSQFSAVTNTTQSRFKTKAAMKGYENGNADITLQTQDLRARPACKLTELADIALGHDDKPVDEPAIVPTRTLGHTIVAGNAKRVITPEYVTMSVVDGRKADGCHFAATKPPATNQADNKKKTMAIAETQGSTSSKTIMHSSIIKAAVEEHSKEQATSKIIIPERPFKNIGLEEKATITFQKPKTTAVNLLMDDGDGDDDVNSVSTASYSDRDDFDFNSMSCDDDTSIKNSNEKNLKSNSSESSSSRATAKTFENKSLIMGRIFKNASTKAKATPTATSIKSVAVQKDHTPKADLNQLFDELRGGDARLVKASSTDVMPIRKDFVAIAAVQQVPVQSAQTKESPFSAAAKPQSANENIAPKSAQDIKRKAVATATATASSEALVSKKQSKQNKKLQKDLSQLKLQTELGMSQEEIEKLIDEGQRKSKRRCAANRSKKLVETWSSDEYEEFLSTKDIIALIEEKEKQEQRRKRKSSLGGDTKEKSLLPTTASTTTTSTTTATTTAVTQAESLTKKYSTPPAVQTGAEKSKFKEKGLKSAPTDSNRGISVSTIKEKENTRQSNLSAKETKKNASKIVTEKLMPTTDECTNSSIAASSWRSKKTTKNVKRTAKRCPKDDESYVQEIEPEAKIEPKLIIKKQTAANAVTVPTPDQTVGMHTDSSGAASETDDNLYLLDIKRNINNNINSTNKRNRAKKDKPAAKESSFKEVNQEVAVNSFKPRRSIESKKRESNAISVVSSSSNKKNKGRRKAQTEKLPVRKRKAAEKLYYWSSSSDEEFGRINEHAHEPEFENTEQYQKHGWIVGDSHKKLVTLLAIAKGNKKQVENCGVKKNNSKKRN